MRLQDISKRVSRKWKKWNTTVWEKSYKYQVPHRVQSHANVFNHSNTLFLFRYQNRVLLIMLSFIHLISIMQIKTLATSGVHLDTSINQPLGENLWHCMTWQVMFTIFQTDFIKIIPWSKDVLDLSAQWLIWATEINLSKLQNKQAASGFFFFPRVQEWKKSFNYWDFTEKTKPKNFLESDRKTIKFL